MPVQIILSQIAALGILVLIGILTSWLKVFNPASKDFLAKIIFNITLPAMVFTNFTKVELTERLLGNSILFLFLAILVLFFMLLAGWITSRMMKLHPGASGIFRIHSMQGNIIYLGFPVISSLFGNEGLLYASIFALVSNILMWTVGVMTISSGREESLVRSMRHVLNPNSIAVVLGFIFFLLSLRLPKIILDPLTGLGSANTYLSMLYIGSVIYFASIKQMARNMSVYILSFNKLLLVPFLILWIFIFLNSFLPVKIDPLVISVLVMQSAMPCMVNVVILVNYLGEDDRLATANVFMSTVLSIVTLPLIVIALRFLR